MKLVFSEYKSDYGNYIFPYAIWAIPEPHEMPAMIFGRGFLPAARDFSQFYMCRHVRVVLGKFEPSSENRRIMRKCEGIEYTLVPRSKFDFTHGWRDFCKNYADIKFGKDVMTNARLDSLFESAIISHVLVFTDTATGRDIGIATLYVEGAELAYFYYSFYDLNYYIRNLGMYIMTSAIHTFSQQGTRFMYLGTCYSRNALYKTQFAGAEFFNGFRWSDDLKELKYLIGRDQGAVTKHLVETEDFVEKFYSGRLESILQEDSFVFPALGNTMRVDATS